MEEEEGGLRLSKRFSDKGGEVDFKTKAGTAWSHNFLNQKPWHPLSYPNQRRKWIAEQTFAEKQRRSEEVSREYAQEQEFFRQTALVSKKEKEKLEMMKAVSFMYVRPPGYNAESAKAAEIADEQKKQGQDESNPSVGASSSKELESMPSGVDKKKPRPKDVFGRPLPTEEQFEVLKNAPRLETGVHGRAKPFGVEVRNVKCVRCGNFGHQSGDRECPLKDVIMPNEESRLKRDDPLTAIIAQTDSSEPLKWELKQKPGLSPPRGGFKPDDPNQQIVAEDIFDEYGGFLSGDMPELLASFSSSKAKKKKSSKSKNKRRLSPITAELSDREEDGSLFEDPKKKSSSKSTYKRQLSPTSAKFNDREADRSFSENGRVSRSGKKHRRKTRKLDSESSSSDTSDYDKHRRRGYKHRGSPSSSAEPPDTREEHKHRHRRRHREHNVNSSDDSDSVEKYRSKHHHRRNHQRDHHRHRHRSSHSNSSSE